jgi:hypothetical protein
VEVDDRLAVAVHAHGRSAARRLGKNPGEDRGDGLELGYARPADGDVLIDGGSFGRGHL